jgi:hypothetical protein
VIFNYTNEGTFKNPFILWALYVKWYQEGRV